MSEATYEDIKRLFSKSDLARYDLLCKEFVSLTTNKNNVVLWKMVQTSSRLQTILDEIHKIRQRYDFLKGDVFFKVWRINPLNDRYEEVCW
jgi:hypothetical protein